MDMNHWSKFKLY